MYTLHTWPTPNSYKVTIFMREAGLSYDVRVVNISQGEQFRPEFLELNPNNKIPVLVDAEPLGQSAPLVLSESGCILEYLADKTGRFLAPAGDPLRYETLNWLYWQMAGLGPMLGQNHHFTQYAPEKIPYAIERYLKESQRLYSVLDHRLRGRRFVAGEELSIADMAIYPWIVPHEKQGLNLSDYPDLQRWFEAMKARPAVREAYAEGDLLRGSQGPTVNAASRQFLFGQDGQHLRKKGLS